MAHLEKNIADLLEKHGIDWNSNVKLADDIKTLATNTVIEDIKAAYVNTDRVKEGIECPICEQNIKIHCVSLNKTLCELLIKACKLDASGQKYFHVVDDLDVPLSVGGAWAKLRHWGLIEPQPNPANPSKALQGMWCVTVKAMEFIGDKKTIPSKIYLYNSNLVSMHRDNVSILDVIGDFDQYAALMNIEDANEVESYVPPIYIND